jgi:hypothetical protein
MSLISGFLQGQAPPKQDASCTIQTLCLRLSSSTLLEDRRAAILGLRSFSRDYQELVASEGLRELIATLARDREDLDTVKAVLETLLNLFAKDESMLVFLYFLLDFLEVLLGDFFSSLRCAQGEYRQIQADAWYETD